MTAQNIKLPSIMALIFLSGVAVMAFEILGSRALAPTFGSSIFVWGSLIAVFLAGLAVGYVFGGWLSDRNGSFGFLALLLTIPGLMILSFPLWGYPAMELIYQWAPGPRSGPFWACMLLFFIPTCFLGTVFPFCVRLAISDLSRLGRGVGLLYGVSTFGSLVGTLGAAFYLVVAMGTRSSLVLVGSLLLLCAGWAFFLDHRRL